MSWVITAVVGGTILGGVMAADAQGDAADTAAATSTANNAASIAEQRRQFDEIQKLLKPYVDAGEPALLGQQSLIGLKGAPAQAQAIKAIEDSPEFGALIRQGENAILQNASATGGLRGGNIQAALAKFRPNVLSALIDQQFSRLSGLTQLGQNSAAMVGNAGMNTGTNISSLLRATGEQQANAALAGGRAQANMFGSIGSGIGTFGALGGFNRIGSSSGYGTIDPTQAGFGLPY